MATNNIFYKRASGLTHFHKTTLCTYISSIIQIQSISLQYIINNSTDTNVRRILICSSVRSVCTWKIVFKTQNNELNEFNECMLYKCFAFSENLKTVKLSFTIYFPEVLLAYLLALEIWFYNSKQFACLLNSLLAFQIWFKSKPFACSLNYGFITQNHLLACLLETWFNNSKPLFALNMV